MPRIRISSIITCPDQLSYGSFLLEGAVTGLRAAASREIWVLVGRSTLSTETPDIVQGALWEIL